MTTFYQQTKLVSVAALLTFAISQQVAAASISFGGQAATDGSGQTSTKVAANNIVTDPTQGIFIETFDTATAVQNFPPANNTTYNVPDKSAGCAVNSPLDISLSTPSNNPRVLGVRTGSETNVAAAPANDSTCYAYTTPAEVGVNSWVDIDFTDFLANIGLIDPSLDGARIGYLGFYWGSVDNYNTFQFYSDEDLVAEVTGPALLAAFNGQSGDQQADSSNKYVNIDFSMAESFNRLRVLSSGIAGEFDNVTVQFVATPAPASLAILGLGLLGLGLSRKYKH